MNGLPARPKPALLIFVEYFLPGYRFGGPVQAVANLVALLRDDYSIFIVTRDRDVGDRQPYAGIRIDEWLERDRYQVLYLPLHRLTLRAVGQLLGERPDALIYTNSLFSRFTRLLLLHSAGTGRPLIVAPRGELHPGAIRLKAYKKQPYVWLLRWLLRHRIRWHATSPHEKTLIQHWFRVADGRVAVAPDLPGSVAQRPPHHKKPGQLRLIWLARIAENKGLRFLLDCLPHVSAGPVTLDIYGPVVDVRYWCDCQRLISAMSARHTITYRGELPHATVGETLSRYDFLVLPTQGENFGHVIAESLSAGLPVLISDQTPWRNLGGQQAGWDLPLERDRWVDALQTGIQFDNAAYTKFTAGTTVLAQMTGDKSAAVRQYRHLFTPVSATL